MARAWTGAFSPFEAVCLAAEQHDAGWMEQDRAPSFNPDTGRARHFLEMPLAAHLAVWRSAAGRVVAQSRYAALLVSLHGTTLYSRRTDPPPEVVDYLDRERAVQRELAAGLDPGEIDVNRRLVLAWDRLSLGLCLQWPQDTIPDVPGFGDLELAGGALSPWPFREPEVTFVTEARRVPGTFGSEEDLRAAYDAAPPEPLLLRLRAAR
jgi:hypothetical protein